MSTRGLSSARGAARGSGRGGAATGRGGFAAARGGGGGGGRGGRGGGPQLPKDALVPRARSNLLGTRPDSSGAAIGGGGAGGAAAAGAAASAPATVLTSRICVKNLPSYITDTRLREVFSGFGGEVTDIKLMKTGDGRFRRFAFIGYVSVPQAATAILKLNNTYIDTSKIVVEPAQPPKSDTLARPWSRHSEGSSAFGAREAEKSAAAAAAKTKLDADTKQAKAAAAAAAVASAVGPDGKPTVRAMLADPNFDKYRAIMAPSKRDKKFWANDDALMLNEPGISSKTGAAAAAMGDGDAKADASALKTAMGDSDDEDESFKNPSIDDTDATPNAATTAAATVGANAANRKSGKRVVASHGDDSNRTLPNGVAHANGTNDSGAADADADAEDADAPAGSDAAAAAPSGVSDLDYFKSKAKAVAVLADEDDDAEDKQIEREHEMDEAEAKAAAATAAAAAAAPSKMVVNTARQARIDAASAPPTAVEPSGDGKHSADQVADVTESGRLFVRNLSYTTTVPQLTEWFAKYGTVTEVHIPVDEAKKPKGFAYILFLIPENAVRAYAELDGTIFQGRLLHILPSKARPAASVAAAAAKDPDAPKSSYKKEQEEKKKASAEVSDNWNSFFIRSDAVADATAAKLGIGKGKLLDAHSSDGATSLATRMALAEVNIISETKQWLAENGIAIAVFNAGTTKQPRSTQTILVKNIPFSTEENELRRLFAKFGALGRVLMPPSKTMAVIEFLESSEAKRAFTGLAFKKFKSVPLYLEWAPVALFTGKAAEAGSVAAAAGDRKELARELKALADKESTVESSSTLFVKNLNFVTDEAGLRRVFGAIGPLKSALVVRHKAIQKGSADSKAEQKSMGYGFVEYESKSDAMKALKQLQNTELDAHKLQLKYSHRGSESGEARANDAVGGTGTGKSGKLKSKDQSQSALSGAGASGEAVSSKLMVKNVPFEATSRDIRDLFSSFGAVRKVRMPKKFGDNHRGFAFVTFVTKQEAKNAVDSLGRVHLLGRPLVLEWAKEEDSVDEIRDRTAEQFTARETAAASGSAEQAAAIANTAASRKRRKLNDEAIATNSTTSFGASFGADD